MSNDELDELWLAEDHFPPVGQCKHIKFTCLKITITVKYIVYTI